MGLRSYLTRTSDRDPLSGKVLHRVDAEPLEGTRMSLFNSIIPSFWQQNGLSNQNAWFAGDAYLAERVWVANRCQQMNAQQIASMPLEFNGGMDQPAWVSNPDPNWYPNGIGDAMHAIVESIYGWGFVCLYVTDFYADGYPRTWTPLASAAVHIDAPNGRRRYKYGDDVLDPARVVQIDRNPSSALHGCSALRSYAQMAWGLMAAGNQSMTVSQGGIPQMYFKSLRKLDKAQAEKLQEQWMTSTASRNGAPAVIPPEIDPVVLSINPADLALLETQEFNAKAIATAYGVPAVLLNMAIRWGMTYQNPGMLGEMWWRFELRPLATHIANAMSAQMLPRGQWVSFDAADTFLPLDATSDENDEQAAQNQDQTIQPADQLPGSAQASPAQQRRPLTAIGGG